MPTITPIAGPRTVEGALTDTQSKASSARDRAIAMLTSQTPQVNPNKVSVEEAGALKAPPPVQEAPKAEGQDSISVAAPEAQKAETAPKEATAPEEAPLSSQYVQLARKEKAIRQQAQELKAQQTAFKAREDALKAKEAEMQSQYVPKSRLASDAWSVLNENGISYESLTQQALNAPSPEAQAQQQVIAKLEAKIQALEDGQNSTKQSIADSQKQAYDEAVSQLRNEAKKLVSKDDTFETIRATNSHEDVVELITKTFKEEGVLLTVEEAASEIEEYLVEEAMKVARLSKIQQRLKPQAVSPAPQQSKQPQPSVTLTNAQGASRQLTARERAILAFKGENKS